MRARCFCFCLCVRVCVVCVSLTCAVPIPSLANVSMGLSGVVYQTTIATSTQPSGNNYIEGCWHLLRQGDEPWPGLILGTGFEVSAYCVVVFSYRGTHLCVMT